MWFPTCRRWCIISGGALGRRRVAAAELGRKSGAGLTGSRGFMRAGGEEAQRTRGASAYDAAAPTFDRHRALPDGAAPAIRAAVLAAAGHSSRPRLLDLGAGSGRIGWPFVAAGDDYVG